MKKRGFPASSVQPLINLWPQVAELLKVRPIEAATIVEQIVKRGKLTLYVENADTGLWNTIRWGEKAKAMVDRLGCNDYAQKFFNDPSVAVDPEATAIRISPAGFNTILAEASEISMAQPDGMPSITAHAAAGSVQPKEEQERLEEEMERARAKTGKAIAQLIDYKYEIFARLICQAVMGIQEEGERNPFYHPDKARDSDREIWGDLADAILTNLFKLSEDYERRKRKTSAERVDTLPIVQGDFIAARAWILQNFYPDRVHAMQFTERQLTHLIDTPSSYLTLMEPRFGDTIGFFCELVYHGIPLYELLPDGAIASSPISFAHEDYIYLSQKGRYFDWKDESCYPYWAKRYFIKREHLRVYYMFFGSDSDTPDPSTVATRRDAFRQKIGFRDNGAPTTNAAGRAASTEKVSTESGLTRKLRTHQQILIALASELGWDRSKPETIIRKSGRPLDIPMLLNRHFGQDAVSDDTIRNTLKEAVRDQQDQFAQTPKPLR